ncbi:MAG: hypothetical protein HYS13_21095 [Planctomycetia bacterium]|nr:hypothetical protein [Planctomycetia bacterium]
MGMQPLLAVEIGTIVTLVVIVLSVLGWIIKQVGQAKQGQRAVAPPQAPPPRPMGQPMPPPRQMMQPQAMAQPPMPQRFQPMPPPPGAAPMRPVVPQAAGQPVQNPLDGFLRELARQLGHPVAPQPMPQPMPPMPQPMPPAPQPASPYQLREAEAVSEDDPYERGGVTRHVQSYMDTAEFDRRSQKMTQGVEGEVAELREEIQEKFEHQVGRLRTSLEASPAYGVQQRVAVHSPVAADILQMLSSARQTRSAIVLQEILRRPTFGPRGKTAGGQGRAPQPPSSPIPIDRPSAGGKP